MFLKVVGSVGGLENAATELIGSFRGAHVFAFHGNMGVGKTTFIQAICKILGSGDYVTSPTFAIVNEYSDAGGNPVYHFDFYRIKNIEEAFDLGYEEYFFSGNFCFIEWPEKIESLLPENRVEVKIEVLDDGSRKITAQIA
jgi:tRNA threonylcarbamoyladenosine biosynthesis protein TsaE